eukprot:1159260-Pelagomonas_calceolata.AAC.4
MAWRTAQAGSVGAFKERKQASINLWAERVRLQFHAEDSVSFLTTQAMAVTHRAKSLRHWRSPVFAAVPPPHVGEVGGLMVQGQLHHTQALQGKADLEDSKETLEEVRSAGRN